MSDDKYNTYTDRVQFTFLGDDEWVVESPVWFRSKVLGELLDEPLGRYEYVVFAVQPPFPTDGASVPWYLRWVISPFDKRVLIPAIGHDYIRRYNKVEYKIYDKYTKNLRVGRSPELVVSNGYSDKFFREKLGSFNMGIIRRWGAYFGVSLHTLCLGTGICKKKIYEH